MNAKNPRVFKFVRKEYQTSDQINPKKVEQKKAKSLPKQQQKLRHYINYFAQQEAPVDQKKKQEPKSQQPTQNQNKITDKKITFDKKMSRVVIPEHLQKIRYIKRIESRLISCLEKRKPHVPVKKLISEEMLVEVMGKNERKLVTKNNIYQKLNIEVQSVKKHRNVQNKPKLNIDVEEIQLLAEKEIHKQRFQNLIFLGSQPQGQLSFQGVESQNLKHESNFQHFNYYSGNLFDNQSCFAKVQAKEKPSGCQKLFPKATQKQKFKFKSMDNLFAKEQSEAFNSESQINLKNLKVPRLSQNEKRQKPHYRYNIQSIAQEEFSFVKERQTDREQPLSIFKIVHKEQQQRNKFKHF